LAHQNLIALANVLIGENSIEHELVLRLLTLRGPHGKGTHSSSNCHLSPLGVKRLRLRASSPVPLAGDIHQGGS
jgi:hypothetical protein